MNYITNVNEARDEARRLSKALKRHVEAKAVDCDCDFSPACYQCAASGTYYKLVYSFCQHSVQDADDLECDQAECAEREREAALVERVETFPRVGAPLKSCAQVEPDRQLRQEAEEAA